MSNAPLEDLVRAAMAAGFACLAEQIASQEWHPSTPLTRMLDDFPAKFLGIRADLTVALDPDPDAVYAAIVAEIQRQHESSWMVYRSVGEDGCVGVDGEIDLRELADAILKVVSRG